MIFVFGSNCLGLHGAGAALFAVENYGATYGLGFGPQGSSFAIPTKATPSQRLELWQIQHYVNLFLEYAKAREYLVFEVTRIGCGLAGYTDADIAPLFKDAPVNCQLPIGWRVP